MEKILLYEDKNLLNEICGDLSQYLPVLTKVKKNYNNLEMGNFNNKIFKEIVLVGIVGIEDNFTKYLENQMKKMDVTNSVLKQNLLNGCRPLFQSFANSVSELKKFKPETYSRNTRLKLKHISFNDEVFCLSNNDKEEILEDECRIYLDNKRELELYKDLTKFIEAYEKVSSNLKNLKFQPNYRTGEEITGINKVFLEFNDGKYSIIPGSIKFASNYRENSLKNS
ncbi:MAG: hypothetical protein ACYCZ2_09390 [Lutibacter sp.]